jgi:beta-glucosidase
MKSSVFHSTTILVLWSLASYSAVGQTPLYLDPTAPVDQRVEDLLGRMTLDEKIGQMMQVDHPAVLYHPSEITSYFMGSVLSGGGSDIGDNTTATWAALHDTLQSYALKTRLGIPIIYGIDAVHGNNNIYGATIFPHNIGLGCTRDSALVYEAARVTAEEVAATGIEWTFAPCVAVPRNERWGRTYEGFGETPELASMMGAAAVRGFQGDSLNASGSIVACAKHYVGDGGTTGGANAGNMQVNEAVLREIHLPGYQAAVEAETGSIMVSFSRWNDTLMSAERYLLTDVLKGELAFKGFLVSDWGAIDALGSDYTNDVALSVNAGIDMVMLPYRYVDFWNAMHTLVGNGTIPMTRVDDAVRRILIVKFRKGVFEHPFSDPGLQAAVGSAAHREVARECVRKSIVLLQNSGGILPLVKIGRKILVAGSHASNIGYQCGGWTISWQGSGGPITPGTTILEGMQAVAPADEFVFSQTGDFGNTSADYSVVVVGELPYAEGSGDRSDLSLNPSDVTLIQKMKGYGHPVVVVLISGRPLIITGILGSADAIVAAWLPGTEGEGIADVLFGDSKPTGVLSHSWPRTMSQIPINVGDPVYDPLYPYGYGLSYTDDGVASLDASKPNAFGLFQNYPNPFNPTTTIEFNIGGVGASTNVNLTVYDVLGREVAELVDKRKVPGNYEVTFDASDLSSGVYFYRFTAGEYVQTRRMVVLK